MPDYEKIADAVEVPESLWPKDMPAIELPADEPKIEVKVVLGAQTPASPFSAPARRVTDEKYQGLAAEKGYAQDHSRVEKLNYTHDAMIDVIVAKPNILQKELAAMFGYREAWVSRIIGSDAFQAALAKRREEVADPFLVATLEERFNGLAMQSIDVIMDKLELTKNADLATKALDISAKALGFGARTAGGGQIQNNFVVQLPQKIASAGEWAEKHTGGKTIEG